MDRRNFMHSLIAGSVAGGLGSGAHAGPAAESSQVKPAAPANPPGSKAFDPSAAARTLSEHRIARIESWRSNDRYPRYVGRNSRGRPAGRGWGRQMRTITTDKGVQGWAMSGAPDEKVRPLVGARVADIFDLERGTADEAFFIDQAMHDLVGRILDLPVYRLIGAAGPNSVPIYSGAIYFDDLEPPDKPRGVAGVVASCRQDYDAGYRAFKLKIGRGFKWIKGPEGRRRDIEVTRAVRERFPDCKILVDANDSYAVGDFLEYVTAVADCGLYCIEEPFRENRDDLRRLRDHMEKVGCKALIMEGESGGGRAESPWRYGEYAHSHIETLHALAKEKLIDVINLDLGMGFTRWRNVMPELVEAGVYVSPHTWGGTPRPYYVAHLAAGVGNVCIVEGIPGKATGLDYSAFKLQDGNIVLPDRPGFGVGRTP